MKKGLFAFFILVMILSACKNPGADLVLKNGQIYTLEENQPWASAVVITGNKIVAVLENDKEVSKFIGPSTQVIDLKGNLLCRDSSTPMSILPDMPRSSMISS